MPQSTTTTIEHILQKYSRSYPNTKSTEANSEWQRFSNPVIRLTLDTKSSSAGILESVRLRISWSVNSSADSMDCDQREVDFEDLDLLSFSNLPTTYSTQSLPLKAVYKDSLVGFRYLHPRIVPPGATLGPHSFRRFQINFLSNAAASQFIESIRPVCPCKLDASSQAPTGRSVTALPPVPQIIPSSGSRLSSSEINRQLRPFSTTLLPTEPLPVTFEATNLPSSQLTLNMDLSRPASSSSNILVSDFSVPSQNIAKSAQCPISAFASQRPVSHQLSDSSIPSSSPVSSDPQSGPFLPPASAQGQISQPDPFIESLRQYTGRLYDVPPKELEKLVGDIVRDEKFACLLEKLDALWNVKCALGC